MADKVRQLVSGGELIETKKHKRNRKPKPCDNYETSETSDDLMFTLSGSARARTIDWIDELVESVSKIPPRVVNTETVIESVIDSPFDEHVIEAKVNTDSKEFIVIQNNQAVTSSLQVAETFGKQHKNVLRDIEAILEGMLNFEQTPMFYKATYEHPQNKQIYPIYYMNRDGFTLLAMGFIGKKALQFKIDYINQFNLMENQLKSQTQPVLVASYMIDNPIERAKQWIEEQQEKMLLAETVQEQVKVIEHKEEVIEEKVQIIEGLTDNLPVADQRQMIVTVLRQGCVGNYLVMAERWSYLYSEFNKVYHMNVKVKMFFQQKDKMKLANLNHGLIIERLKKESFIPCLTYSYFLDKTVETSIGDKGYIELIKKAKGKDNENIIKTLLTESLWNTFRSNFKASRDDIEQAYLDSQYLLYDFLKVDSYHDAI